MKPAHPSRGFTLVEMATVLLILGLVIGTVLSILPQQIRQQRSNETTKILESVNEALIGYALSTPVGGKPYLPCPDTNADGLEDRSPTGACVGVEGLLPWATLGLGQQDAWGRHLRYRVIASYADTSTGITLATPAIPHLLVCTTPACSTLTPDYVQASNVPALVMSFGANGYGGTEASGQVHAPPPAANVHELANTDGNAIYVWHEPRPAGGIGGEFDDVVNWVSPGLLRNRLIAAGRLP